MCAELRHCQRWVTNRERQRVPQWRTRDGKTSLSVNRRSCSRYRQIAACCRSEMTSASGSRNRVAHHSKVDWCRLVKTLEDQQTNLVLHCTASRHLLLYVVYVCQKSFNFITALACYKQKCKLAPFNLAHPVFSVKNLTNRTCKIDLIQL